MNAPRFVRGTKSRFFLYLGALVFMGLIIYVYHGAQLQLDDVRQSSEKCQQQQESLSAQLQVIFEYKLRLEKSLQQEKNEHRQTKEELQLKADEEKAVKDKEILESMNKYTSLQQQHKLLKSQHNDLEEECNNVRISQLQGLEDKSKLEAQVQAVQQELESVQAAKEKDLENLKSSYMQLEIELDKVTKLYKDLSSKTDDSTNKINYLQKQNNQIERELTAVKVKYNTCKYNAEIEAQNYDTLDQMKPAAKIPSSSPNKTTTTASGAHVKAEAGNYLAEPDREALEKVGSKSTTPQINPDAIISQDRVAAAINANNVVPMPPPNAGPVKSLPSEGAMKAPPKASPIKNLPSEGAMKPPPPAQPLVAMKPLFNAAMKAPPRQEAPGVRVPPHREVFNWQQDHVPAGVVPAPNGYQNSNYKDPRQEVGNEVANAWGWNYRKPHGNVNLQVVNEPVNHIQYMNNRNAEHLANDLQHRGRLLVEPQKQHAYPYNGDYEKDGQRNDLQLEEAEEDGDDDVDQIDYGNEAGKQKMDGPMPGIMVNPK